MLWPIAYAGAFLAGSIPFGLLIARAHSIDIRAVGSGNIGATNVVRTVGIKPGILCFVLDVLKGFIPALAAGIAAGIVGSLAVPEQQAWLWLGVVIAAVAGHMFSPWVRFKGGKGVATGLGAMLGIFPALTTPGLAAFVAWIVIVKRWRMVGIASVIAAALLPVLVAAQFAIAHHLDAAPPFIVVTSVLAVLIIVRHRSNIARTLAGTEPKIGEQTGPGLDHERHDAAKAQ